MLYHPQPNGGDKPLGKPIAASKEFVEAFALLRKYSAQKAELTTMLNHSAMSHPDADRCKKNLREQIGSHEEFITQIFKLIAIMSTASEAVNSAN